MENFTSLPSATSQLIRAPASVVSIYRCKETFQRPRAEDRVVAFLGFQPP